MNIRRNLKPGQKGTKKLAEIYGDSLVCVRYRYDEKRKKRLKTVEIIIDETDWKPREKICDRHADRRDQDRTWGNKASEQGEKCGRKMGPDQEIMGDFLHKSLGSGT
ncbi:Uncharacterized protein dnm_078480 [Desulfonema magnum]|uniref:Uncharacterized protein n=1 Tax=Desulfonema magnum TaxID=45655 RepID=A0A975BU45_9BACT|nr:Uncharacterized protein dnm_078480 [Desulfonema magnum]